jgi:glycosyltransferase involved in cell wall biosynthesis
MLSLCKISDFKNYFVDKKVFIHSFDMPVDMRARKSLTAIFKLRKFLIEKKINILFITGTLPIPVVSLIRPFIKCKVVFCDHENMVNRSKKSVFFRKTACKISDKVVVLTDRSLRDYINILGINTNKIERIYNYIDDDIYQNADKCNVLSKNIISVGRISSEKGFDLAVEAANHVFNKHRDWQWHIYGDGPDYEKIDKKIKDYGLQNNFILKGFTNSVREKYKNYSIYVLPSYREGLPVAMLEAKCNMLPLVSFDCATGPSEIINDGVDGYLIECYNVEKMAEKICDLIKDASLREEFSKKSKNNLYKFAKDNILSKWINLIDNL